MAARLAWAEQASGTEVGSLLLSLSLLLLSIPIIIIIIIILIIIIQYTARLAWAKQASDTASTSKATAGQNMSVTPLLEKGIVCE